MMCIEFPWQRNARRRDARLAAEEEAKQEAMVKAEQKRQDLSAAIGGSLLRGCRAGGGTRRSFFSGGGNTGSGYASRFTR